MATTRGKLAAEGLIDATGWRAAPATHSQRREESPTAQSSGVQTDVSVRADGLHFHYQSSFLGGNVVGWMFPAGGTARVERGSYRGRPQLN